ncbi:MAG TPA: right-handed parallel beta-helix repeat-containing protein [Polyangiaceae bacterium]
MKLVAAAFTLLATGTLAVAGCHTSDSQGPVGRAADASADAATDGSHGGDATGGTDGALHTGDGSPDDGGAANDAVAPDAPADSPPPPPLVGAGPIVISGETDASVVGVHVTSTTGDCITVTGSSHVSIRGSDIGPCAGNGVVVTGSSSDVTIADSWIHPEHPTSGCCDTGDGVFVSGADTVTLQGNVIAWGEANLEATSVTHLTVVGNFLLNPQNSGSRGQNVQVWGSSSDVDVEGNYALSSTDPKWGMPEEQEDSINFGFTDGIVAKGNYVQGGHSPSGCGIIADEAANGVQFLSNVLVDNGQCGIGISDGTTQVIDSDQVIDSTPVDGGGNTGIYVWKQYAEPCGPVTISNSTSSALKPDMTTESGYWNGGGCDPVTLTNDTWDQAARAALTPVAQKLPPPLVPPKPLACLAPSPFVTQVGFPPCASK